MTAIFMSISRNGKRFRKRKTEIIGVMQEQPVSERENLWTGSFSLFPQSVLASQNHCHLNWDSITQWRECCLSEVD